MSATGYDKCIAGHAPVKLCIAVADPAGERRGRGRSLSLSLSDVLKIFLSVLTAVY